MKTPIARVPPLTRACLAACASFFGFVPNAVAQAPAEPPTATDAAPPPSSPSNAPEARPIEALGDARWSESLGFYQPSDAPQDSGGSPATAPRAPAVGDRSLNLSYFRFGGGSLLLNPTNQDGEITADDRALTVLDVPLQFYFEWRNMGRLLGFWLDLGTALHIGERTEVDDTGTETGQSMGVGGFRLGGRFGLDLHPVSQIGLGPFVGARLDFYSVTLDSTDASSTVTSESSSAVDAGLVYGLHARLRTKERPGTPAVLFVDPALTFKQGPFQTGQYGSIDAGVRLGDMYVYGWFEKRLGSSGSFDLRNDVADVAEAYAASMPVDQRFGLSLAILMAGG